MWPALCLWCVGVAHLLAGSGLYALAHTAWPCTAQWPRSRGQPTVQNSTHCPAGAAQLVARAVVSQTTPGSNPQASFSNSSRSRASKSAPSGKRRPLFAGHFDVKVLSCSGSSCCISSRSEWLSIANKRAAIQSGDSWLASLLFRASAKMGDPQKSLLSLSKWPPFGPWKTGCVTC